MTTVSDATRQTVRVETLPGSRCDFCANQLGETWERFESRDFSRCVPQGIIRYRGSWAACSWCAPLVRRRQWRKLADRVMGIYSRRNPDLAPAQLGACRSELAALWQVLERHLTGVTRAGGAA